MGGNSSHDMEERIRDEVARRIAEKERAEAASRAGMDRLRFEKERAEAASQVVMGMRLRAGLETEPVKQSKSYDLIPPDLSELRVVLLGSSWSQRSSVGSFILGEDVFKDEAQCCLKISKEVEKTKITVINTPDVPKEENQTAFIKDCAEASAPGPHVFLLVLQPENFTDEDKNRIYRILKTFNPRSFDHSFLLILKSVQDHMKEVLIKELIKKCRYRYLKMEDIERSELLTRFGQIVKENNGEHVSYEESKDAAAGSDVATGECSNN